MPGYLDKYSFGSTGLFSKPPPQFGQTFCRMVWTQISQNVHSKAQIIASLLFGGRWLLVTVFTIGSIFNHLALSNLNNIGIQSIFKMKTQNFKALIKIKFM